MGDFDAEIVTSKNHEIKYALFKYKIYSYSLKLAGIEKIFILIDGKKREADIENYYQQSGIYLKGYPTLENAIYKIPPQLLEEILKGNSIAFKVGKYEFPFKNSYKKHLSKLYTESQK